MNQDEVLKLIDAGFTADEIRGMSAKPEAGEPAPEGTPEPAPAPAPTPEAKAPEVSAEIQNLTEQISKLNETVVKLQEANIKNARTGSAKVDDPVNEQITKFIQEL
mgnify:CR=1 FL=1